MIRFRSVTQGAVVAAREVGDFRLTETTHRPALRLARHAHDRPSTTFVLEGSFTERVSNAAYACGAASVLLKPGGEPHADLYGPRGARCLIVEWLAGWQSDRPSQPCLFDQASLLPAAVAGDLAARLYAEFRAGGRASSPAIEELLLEVLHRVERNGELAARSGSRRWLPTARAFLHAHFAEPIRIRDAARAAGVHPVHLARAFRNEHGRSPSAYLRDLRLGWARRALAQGSRPLARIALEAGFADQSHLSRTFKRAYGVSPRRFRESLRETDRRA